MFTHVILSQKFTLVNYLARLFTVNRLTCFATKLDMYRLENRPLPRQLEVFSEYLRHR